MIEFQLFDIWSKFHRKVIVSYCTDSHTVVCAVMEVAKVNILFMAWRLVGS